MKNQIRHLNKIKKLIFKSLPVFVFLLLSLWQIGLAAEPRTNCPEGGLVPCGTEGCPCQLCDLFAMITKIIGWFVGNIVLPVGALMLIIGGVMFMTSAGDPQKLERAKSLLKSTAIGLVIFFCGWLVIGFFINAIGVVHVNHILTPWNVESFCPL
jgi:predicted secreted protein